MPFELDDAVQGTKGVPLREPKSFGKLHPSNCLSNLADAKPSSSVTSFSSGEVFYF